MLSKKIQLVKNIKYEKTFFFKYKNLLNIEHTVKQTDNMLLKPQTVINNKVYLVAENIYLYRDNKNKFI